MSELLPALIRSAGIAVAYKLSVALFGDSAPFVSTWLIKITGDILSPWYFYVGTGLISIVALLILRKDDFVVCSSFSQIVTFDNSQNNNIDRQIQR